MDDGDELYPNGIFVFNITKMIKYISEHKDDIALECQSAFKIDPPSVSKNDPPQALVFSY